jgi:hypothetical protein
MQNIALFLDEPPFPASWAKTLIANVAGSFGWWSCDDCGGYIRGIGIPIQHAPHDDQAGEVFDAIDAWNALSVSPASNP